LPNSRGSYSRTGRNPAGPSLPSCACVTADLRRASCVRQSAGFGRATALRPPRPRREFQRGRRAVLRKAGPFHPSTAARQKIHLARSAAPRRTARPRESLRSLLAAPFDSCGNLRIGKSAQCFRVMATREGKEAFIRCNAVRKIRFQQSFHGPRCIGGLDVSIKLLAELGIRTKPPAGEQMIALHSLVFLADGDLCSDQPDIADVMLSARMMATGQ